MPYHERSGKSKLHPALDGLRFLSSILRTVLLYRPSRPLGFLGILGLLITAAMMLYPTWFYLQHSRLEEWMIYRFLVAELLSTVALLLLSAGHLGSKAADISLSRQPVHQPQGILARFFASRLFWAVPATMIFAGLVLVWDAWVEYLRDGTVHEHWSRFVAMGVLVSMTAVLVVTKILDFCLNLLAERLQYLRHEAKTLGGPKSGDDASD